MGVALRADCFDRAFSSNVESRIPLWSPVKPVRDVPRGLEAMIASLDDLFDHLLMFWQNEEISETEIVILFSRLVTRLRRVRRRPGREKKLNVGRRVLVASLPREPHFILAPIAAEYLSHLGYSVEYWTGRDEVELAEKIRVFGKGPVVLTSSPIFARAHQAGQLNEVLTGMTASERDTPSPILLGRFADASEHARERAGFAHYCSSALDLPNVLNGLTA